MIEIDWLEKSYKWFTVIVLSMLKFVGGPIAGLALRLTLTETIVLTIFGMMLSVFLVSTSGLWFRNSFLSRFQKKKMLFSAKNRRIVSIWKKYGIVGVAILTPILFTPIGGTALVVSFGEPLLKIWLYMFVAAIFWGVSISFVLYYFGNLFGLK